MFTIFTDLPLPVRGARLFPEVDVYRDGVERNIRTMVRYYQTNTFATLNQHLLVRLLGSLSIPFGSDVRKYYDAVYDLAYELASAMNITSPYRTGKPSDTPWLYGDNCVEFPVALHEKRWTLPPMDESNRYGMDQYPPLRILRHPRSDLSFHALDGKGGGSENGVVVWTIDIPLLACQWRAFYLDQKKKASGDTLGEQHFLMKYVLPSIIRDHVRVASANALIKTYQGLPTGDDMRRQIVGLPGFDLRMDALYKNMANWVKDRKLSYAEMVNSLQLATPDETWRLLFTMPDALYTRQVKWVLFLAQLPYVDFLMTLDKASGASINDTINQLALRELRYAKNDSVFRQQLLGNAYSQFMTTIDRLLA